LFFPCRHISQVPPLSKHVPTHDNDSPSFQLFFSCRPSRRRPHLDTLRKRSFHAKGLDSATVVCGCAPRPRLRPPPSDVHLVPIPSPTPPQVNTNHDLNPLHAERRLHSERASYCCSFTSTCWLLIRDDACRPSVHRRLSSPRLPPRRPHPPRPAHCFLHQAPHPPHDCRRCQPPQPPQHQPPRMD
jgi:hypothetical protein